jgi:hypothetical protein
MVSPGNSLRGMTSIESFETAGRGPVWLPTSRQKDPPTTRTSAFIPLSLTAITDPYPKRILRDCAGLGCLAITFWWRLFDDLCLFERSPPGRSNAPTVFSQSPFLVYGDDYHRHLMTIAATRKPLGFSAPPYYSLAIEKAVAPNAGA